MQHFEPSGYQSGLYGGSPSYDGSSIKLHHGHFQETPETCYNSFLSPTSSPGNYISREPPSYAESTLLHGGFVPNTNSAYYKMPTGRQMDIGDYGLQRNTDGLLTKSDILDNGHSAHGIDQIHHRYDALGGGGGETEARLNESGLNNHHEEVQHIKLETNHEYKQEIQTMTQQQRLSPGITESEIPSETKDETLKVEKEIEPIDIADPSKGHDEKAHGNADVKPALSYIALIAKAILESTQKRLSLGSIYSWIEKNYPYYLNRGQGWRNSVRHNLSLNDCFIKAGRCEDGKGNYWAIHPANIQDFMRGDFRQRRRSRRRGRKKDCDIGMYHMANGYAPLAPSVPFSPSTAPFSSIYSPYTDAERRAYRLDEALLRQSMNNPFMKWYHNGVPNGSYNTSQNTGCNSTMYPNSPSSQWQGYGDQSYQLNPSLSRNYSTTTLV